MATHYLKCWEMYFDPIAEGRKTFEIRKNDRDYQTGDVLVLRCCENEPPHVLTNPERVLAFRVSYVTSFGMMKGWVCMGLGEKLHVDYTGEVIGA